MLETTFMMIKPDGIQHLAQIIQQINDKHLQIVAMRMQMLNHELLNQFCADKQGRYFYDRLMCYLQTGPVVMLAIKGDLAIETVLSIKKALRTQYAENKTIDVVHCSEHDEVERELQLFFKPEELLEYPLWNAQVSAKVNAVPDVVSLPAVKGTLFHLPVERGDNVLRHDQALAHGMSR